MKIKYDATAKTSYGAWLCDCGCKFYDGGPRGCKCTSELTYLYTTHELTRLVAGKEPGLAPIGLLKAYNEGRTA